MADPAEDAFARAALRLAPIAARLLGWRMPDFWQATPAELAMALDPHEPIPSAPSRAEITRMMEHDDE